jgi:hypothetical protein
LSRAVTLSFALFKFGHSPAYTGTLKLHYLAFHWWPATEGGIIAVLPQNKVPDHI